MKITIEEATVHLNCIEFMNLEKSKKTPTYCNVVEVTIRQKQVRRDGFLQNKKYLHIEQLNNLFRRHKTEHLRLDLPLNIQSSQRQYRHRTYYESYR